MSKGVNKGIYKSIKKGVELAHIRAIFAVDAAQEKILKMSPAETISEKGVQAAAELDALALVQLHTYKALCAIRQICPDEDQGETSF